MVIKIHIYLFLVLAYMYAIQNLENFVIAYFFIVLHELSHIFVATLLRVKIREIELLPVGINVKYIGKISCKKELLISLAGPVASLLFYKLFNISFLKYMNLLIALINLIPLKPYDGGRIIQSLFTVLFGEKITQKTNIIIQKMCLNFLAIIAIFSIVKFKNYYLAMVCIYMICIAKEELKNEKFNELIKYLQID